MDKERIVSELLRRRDEERFRYFVPNLRQEQFIRSVGEGKHFIYLFIGGNGVGKTALAMNILGNIVWGPQNEWFDFPLFRQWPYPKNFRVVTESQDVKENGSIDTEIRRWWPKGRYTGSNGGKNYISQWKTDTGFFGDKMTFEQESKEFESVTLGCVVFNEPPPEHIFNACVSRMRQGGILLFHMTPLVSSAWIQDKLLDTHSQRTHSVFADIEDNCKDHGSRGILSHDNIEKMMETWDPDEIDARAHGKFMHLTSVILGKAFKRDYHVIPDDTPAPVGSQFFHVVDPARGKPWAMAWGWIDPRGQIVFDREYPLEDWTKTKETKLTTRDYVDIVHVMDEKQPIEWRIIDRHYANARDDYGSTLKIVLGDKFGLDFMDSYSCEEEVNTGIQRVKDALGFNERMPVDESNFPRLRIKERCKNIIRSLERWDRDPDTLQPKKDSHYKDHWDLVRYVCGAGLEVDYSRPSLVKQRKRYVLGG